MRFWLILLAVMVCGPALAAEPKPLNATYGLFTGGVRMIDVNATFDLKPATYGVRTDARTTGVFSKLLPWSGTFETTGASGFRPVRHDYTVRWRSDEDKATFVYEPAGTFKTMTQTKGGQTKTDPVDPDIAKGTRDLLSTTMTMLDKFEKTGSCNTDVLAFDNARSFTVRFRDKGTTFMNNPRLSSYTGQAHGCTVEIVPEKGKWPKKPRGWLRIQQQAAAGGQLPTLWLASPGRDMPVIPVRVDIRTKYGDVIAHLAKVN